MTIAKAIYNALVSDYKQDIVSITTLSKPDQAGKNFIESDYCGFNFDNVKNLAGDKPFVEKSPDAIFVKGDEFFFVEFKSGAFEKKDLRSKIHEGITTLYQFAINKKIVDRKGFLDIPINYVVVATTKHASSRKKCSSFLNTLELTSGYFGLKNMEGFLIKKASMLTRPESIYGKFQDITDNSIEKMVIHCPTNGSQEFLRS